ncbi:hypothetical protein A8F94_22290 [Bacillus sp. FJAT-27225]|uniref:FixH family protein n=1 Tax=Bacillus sp. FJAT-27225 TaxID=1743144 RepID=UPI00080C2AE3|nr:FixH family protein [Bacillus sp. FJAT-27225]OCA81601.1 hypothetical protein A8F94_22290 [Bacillus sp. FJAT-27225]
MKKLLVILVGLFLLALAGCGKSNENNASNGNKNSPPQMVEVMFNIPEKVEQNKEAELKVHVTQGDENVEDANEVKFEIRKQGASENEMIEAEHKGEGIYSIRKIFSEPGKYDIISHVTAREMHTMPKVTIDVAADPEAKDSGNAESKESADVHHAHGVQMEFSASPLQAGKENLLKVTLVNEGKPLTDAAVRFEVWKDGAEKHEFLDASGLTDGAYETRYTFSEPGTYHVQIHVEKGDIHDHKEEEITVE